MTTLNLFPIADSWRAVAIADADVALLPSAPLSVPAQLLFDRLQAETPWRSETITLWGKSYPQPRLTAWFGDEGKTYTYSGISMAPQPWTPLLSQLKREVETLTNTAFNSVLVNLYRNNRDSMGFHSDDEPELGAEPAIASLSLGHERTLVFKRKGGHKVPPVRVPLPSGSLLLMRGGTQRHWQHGITKQDRICGPRINLTFRQIVL